MKNSVFNLVLAMLCLTLLECSSVKNSGNSHRIIRMASDTPENFVPVQGVELDTNSCKSPMIDERDGTQIAMVSSSGNGEGNYRLTALKYGVKKGELLRLNRSTGKVLGIVKE